MTSFEQQVEIGLQLEREGKDDQAIEHFRQLLAQYPDDARAHFEYAGAFDSAGRESEAIPHYRHSMEIGLSGDYLQRVYLQLGSSLRNIAAHDEAVEVLREGCAKFPNDAALRVFLAFALESAGRGRDAITELLELAIREIQTAEMKDYARAIRYYTDEGR